MELTVATANTTWLVICQFLLFKIKIYCVAFLAIQSFMNTLFNPSMFQQPQQVRTGGHLHLLVLFYLLQLHHLHHYKHQFHYIHIQQQHILQ